MELFVVLVDVERGQVFYFWVSLLTCILKISSFFPLMRKFCMSKCRKVYEKENDFYDEEDYFSKFNFTEETLGKE